MSSGSNPAKPRLACEIAADRVLVGRLAEGGRSLEACAARELAPGSVIPDLVEGNLRQRDAVSAAVQSALGSVAGRSHDVIAVVPDAAVRVVMLEFDTLPSDAEEAAGVVRFRLKKSLPFDVDKARVSYHAQKAAEGVRVVAAVSLASVLEDYEAAFRHAGFSPGVVLPSMLAALGAAEGQRPTLVVTPFSRCFMTCAFPAARGSCVTITIVLPDSALRRSIKSSISPAETRSRSPVGSSATSRAGSVITARAMATRCCWPPESCPG